MPLSLKKGPARLYEHLHVSSKRNLPVAIFPSSLPMRPRARLHLIPILGDPGTVSWAGLKGETKVFKRGRKSPWVPTLTGPFPNGQENAGSWLGTKNALYYCAQSANSFSWVLFVSSYTTAIISPQLPGLFNKLSYKPETKELPMSWKTFRILSTGAIQFALRKFCFWRITMYRK